MVSQLGSEQPYPNSRPIPTNPYLMSRSIGSWRARDLARSPFLLCRPRGIQVAAQAGVARRNSRCALELRNRLGELAAPGKHTPEVLERLEVVRIAAQDGPVVLDRELGLPRAQPDVTEVVVGARVAWVDRERFLVAPDRLLDPALLCQQ